MARRADHSREELVNLVKYRMDDRQAREVLTRLENAKDEKLIKDYVVGAA